MSKPSLAPWALCMLLGATTAVAAPHKIFVLRSDSTTDWGTRTRIEKAVTGLARNVDRGVSRGETTFADIALSIGCTKGLDGCKGQLLEALMIDELVVITITAAGEDNVKVTVKRASKSSVREATATVAKADPDAALTAGIGPLFGAHKIIGEKPTPAAKPGKGTMTTGAVEVTNEAEPKHAPAKPESDDENPLDAKHAAKPAPPTEVKTVPVTKPDPKPAAPPAEVKPAPEPEVKPEAKPEAKPVAKIETKPLPAPTEVKDVQAPAQPATAQPTAAPASPSGDVDEGGGGRRPLYIGGIVAGGVTALVGVLLWDKANSLGNDAKAAPNRSAADIANLLDIESSGDHYALAGNIFFIGGLAIAGVSTYLYWRSGSTTAHVAPLAVDHGGGVALTLEVP